MFQVPCKLVASQFQPRDILRTTKNSQLVANISKSGEVSGEFRGFTLRLCFLDSLGKSIGTRKGKEFLGKGTNRPSCCFHFHLWLALSAFKFGTPVHNFGLFFSPLTCCFTFSFITLAGTLMNKLESQNISQNQYKKSINPKNPQSWGACAPACQQF